MCSTNRIFNSLIPFSLQILPLFKLSNCLFNIAITPLSSILLRSQRFSLQKFPSSPSSRQVLGRLWRIPSLARRAVMATINGGESVKKSFPLSVFQSRLSSEIEAVRESIGCLSPLMHSRG
ncbi:hypothetical protein M6B38_379425 [Iris pallida]|uniref:Uncharacterized protein n=1 Tax=Iris pallida TaxID=29817 RepID=A0AAX6G8L2_IRIPA|nr:hypothetical protein M6B38_379425 [Iris pallida]